MLRTLAGLLILLALAVALAIGMVRMRVERAARSVAVVLDGNDARALAIESGRSLQGVLRKFRHAGATGVAAYDLTLPDLIASGQVSVVPAEWTRGAAESRPAETGIAITTEDPRLGQSIAERLASRLPLTALELPQRDSPENRYRQIVFRGGQSELEGMGLGLDSGVMRAADAVGLLTVVRTGNYPGVNDLAMRYAVGDTAAQQVGYVIFDRDELLGYPSLLPNLADALCNGGVVYGTVEFAKQKGDAALCRLLDGAAVRVHSIAENELPTVTREQAAQRFVRAAMERNVRICYVRALTGGWDDRLMDNIHYVREIADGLEEHGFTLGAPSLFGAIAPQGWQVLLIGFGIAGAVMIVLGLLLPVGEGKQWALFGLGLAIAAWLAFGQSIAGSLGPLGAVALPDILGRKLLALVGAIALPTLGLVVLARRLDAVSQATPEPVSWPRLMLTSVGALAGVSAISLLGGLLVAAALTSNLFLIKGDQFSGVKVAMLAPLVILAAVVMGGMYLGCDCEGDYWRRVGDNFRRFFGQPVMVWQAVAALALVGVTLLLIMRTGNESPVGVSPLEMKFRTLLENLLVARPRTKEFLFGHPALMVAVAAALRRRVRLSAVLLVAGAVGQVSLLNTFCHLHSPLALSLLRTVNGLWLGAVVGCVVLLLWRAGARRQAHAR